MTNSGKGVAAPGSTFAAESGDREAKPSGVDATLSNSESPAPQLDKLAKRFEAALAAALGDEASGPPLSAPPRSADTAAEGELHSPATPPFASALRSPRLALWGAEGPSQDGSSPPLVLRKVQPAGYVEENAPAWLPKDSPAEDWEMHGERLPHTSAALLAQDEKDGDSQSRSTEMPSFGDPVEAREQQASRRLAIALWPPRWDSNLIRRGAIPIATLTAIALVGAAVAPSVMAPGSLPTAKVAEEASTGGSVPKSGDQEPEEQRWTISDETVDQRETVRAPQEPITPKLVKTVRVSGSADETADALPRADLPALSPAAATSPEQTGVSGVVRTDEQHSNAGPADSKGAAWSEKAVENASPAERVAVGEHQSAPGEEALVDAEPQVAGPGRWPNAIPTEDDAQAGDRTAAADRADELDLPEDEPALTAAAPAPEEADAESDAETDASPAPSPAVESQSVESQSVESRSVEPTRFAPVTTHVNMRSRPTNKAAVVAVVPAGERVGLIGCAAWCEVVFRGEQGWVFSDFVTGASRNGDVRSGATGRQISAGMQLFSADGALIGTIRSLDRDATGQDFVVVALAPELEASVPSIRLKAEYIAPADGRARIDVTRARLVRSLPSQPSAASAATVAN